MFKAVGRWLKAMGYLLTGRIDSARRALDTDPHVMRAKFDEVIAEKTNRIQQYKQAVAGLIAQQLNKANKIKSLTQEVEKLESLKGGALAKAKQRVKRLQDAGKNKDDIQNDGDYMKCLSAFNDFSSTLSEKQARIAELEADVDQYEQRVKEHKVQLQQLVREIDGIKTEAADTIADLITAKQEKEIADAFSGISEDGSSKDLQELRNLRHEVKAEAQISSELAGTDLKAQEAEFLEYARQSSASSEFDALVGLADGAGTAAPSPEKTKDENVSPLPE